MQQCENDMNTDAILKGRCSGKAVLPALMKGKKVLLWGYGREGKSTEAFLRKYCETAEITVFEGKKADIDEDAYDYLIKSPGIVMEEEDPKVLSQTDLVLMAFHKQVIGITGTKGKSTTSSMMVKALTGAGKKAVLVGNIGKPALDEYETIDEETYIVYEMSCHQLAHAAISPHIAVFLNLYEEHLDYYGTLEKYFLAKSHVAAWQESEDHFYKGPNVPDFPCAGHTHVLPEVPERAWNLTVSGTHNKFNAEVCFRIATELCGCDPDKAAAAIEGFGGLPHRLENLGVHGGIRWYDDSISTIPEAAIGAATSLPDVRTLLIGGMDRGIEYDKLLHFIDERRDLTFILGYATGERIAKELTEMLGEFPANCILVKDLSEQVKTARAVTPPGMGCVLSPAAASYGYFKNFEERGDVFRALAEQE